MGGDTDGFWKIYGGTIKNKLHKDGWRRMVLQDVAIWVDLDNSIHELRVESAPDVCSGFTRHQDVLDGIHTGRAEVTSRTESGSVG